MTCLLSEIHSVHSVQSIERWGVDDLFTLRFTAFTAWGVGHLSSAKSVM